MIYILDKIIFRLTNKEQFLLLKCRTLKYTILTLTTLTNFKY